MDFVLILYAQIISFLIERTYSQYEYQNVQNIYYQNPYQNMFQNGYPMEGIETQEEYEDPQSYRRSRKHRRKPYGNSGGMAPLAEDYSNDESEECNCSCNRCDDPEPCCKNACSNCNTQNQQSLIIVPYPYPFVVTPTVAVTETTISTTCNNPHHPPQHVTETNASNIQNIPPKADSLRHKSNYILTTLRRTKPVWLPKYGIVPIPDGLAEKLMSKLREVKGLKAERRKRMAESSLMF